MKLSTTFSFLLFFLFHPLTGFGSQEFANFSSWTGLSKMTSTAESNYTTSLNELSENTFRWKSPTGTLFTLERKKTEGQPLGYDFCSTPNYLYEKVTVHVTVPQQNSYFYLLCKNLFSTVFMSRTQAVDKQGKKHHYIVKQIVDHNKELVSFLVFAIDPLTKEMPFVCDLFLFQGELKIDQGGYEKNPDCVKILNRGKAEAEKFAKSLEVQSSNVLSTLQKLPAS